MPTTVRPCPAAVPVPARRASRRALLAGLAVAPLAGVLGPAAPTRAAEKVSVALDWYPNANHAGLFLAAANGWFAAAGLDVDLYTPADPATVLQTVGAGRDTFGISYQTDVLLARAAGIPVVSVAALVQRPLLGIMVLKASGITRPRDLVGKTVGYPGIPSQEAYLTTMMAADGASAADVELVNVGFDLTPALVSGRVAGSLGAYWTHETILAEREGYPVDILKVDDWGVPPYYELVLVASEATVRDQPDLVRRFLAAVSRGYEAAIADPAAALDALAAASPDLDRAVETEGLRLLVPVWTEGGVVFGTQTTARWDAYATWMAEHQLIPADLDPAAAWTAAFLPAATATPAAATPEA